MGLKGSEAEAQRGSVRSQRAGKLRHDEMGQLQRRCGAAVPKGGMHTDPSIAAMGEKSEVQTGPGGA